MTTEHTQFQGKRVELAQDVTAMQHRSARELLTKAGIAETPQNILTMMQILATNYLAEVQRLAGM